MCFENLAGLFDHDNLWRNTLMCESISCTYTIGLTDRKKRDELRSAFDRSIKLDSSPALNSSVVRTGSSTRNEVGFTEKPTPTLQVAVR